MSEYEMCFACRQNSLTFAITIIFTGAKFPSIHKHHPFLLRHLIDFVKVAINRVFQFG